jgi:hypothetical protein
MLMAFTGGWTAVKSASELTEKYPQKIDLKLFVLNLFCPAHLFLITPPILFKFTVS